MFLLAMAVLALLVLHVSRPKKHLLILMPISLVFLSSAMVFAFWQEWSLSGYARTASLYVYVVSSFVGMLVDRFMRRKNDGGS
jgi:hypothetical protein